MPRQVLVEIAIGGENPKGDPQVRCRAKRNTLKGLKDFHLKGKVSIWPGPLTVSPPGE